MKLPSSICLAKAIRLCKFMNLGNDDKASDPAALQIDGVWHTGIVLNNLEYYYGAGIQYAPAGSTPFGQPIKIINLG